MFPVGKLLGMHFLSQLKTPVEHRRKHTIGDGELINFHSLFTEYVSTMTFKIRSFSHVPSSSRGTHVRVCVLWVAAVFLLGIAGGGAGNVSVLVFGCE